MRVATVTSGELTGTVAHAAPLAEVGSAAVEDHHAVVAVAVGNIDVTVGGIHGDVRGLVEESLALVCVGVGPRVAASVVVCRPIAHSLSTDLQQSGAAVVAVLLHDAVPVAGNPNVVLVIDEASVDAIR